MAAARARAGASTSSTSASAGCEEGLHDRAITRDLEWGVPMPVEDSARASASTSGSRRSSATCRRRRSGRSAAASRRRGARGGRTRTARDVLLHRQGQHPVPHDDLAGDAHGATADSTCRTTCPRTSTSPSRARRRRRAQGVGDSVLDVPRALPARRDPLRLAANLPETADSDFTEAEFVRRNNDELVATWGNLVNRVLTMTHRNFDGRVPEPGPLDAARRAHPRRSADARARRGRRAYRAVHLKAALARAMAFAQEANAYLERDGAVEDGEDRPRAHGHVPLRRALCYKRAECRALPVPAVLQPSRSTIPRADGASTTGGMGGAASGTRDSRWASLSRCSRRSRRPRGGGAPFGVTMRLVDTHAHIHDHEFSTTRRR